MKKPSASCLKTQDGSFWQAESAYTTINASPRNACSEGTPQELSLARSLDDVLEGKLGRPALSMKTVKLGMPADESMRGRIGKYASRRLLQVRSVIRTMIA